MASLSKSQDFIAVNTLGMGARPGEFSAAKSDPRGWLLSQISKPDSVLIRDSELGSSQQIISGYLQSARARQAERKSGRGDASRSLSKPGAGRSDMNLIYKSEIRARARHAMHTPSSFGERWVRFWSNHFSVSGRDQLLRGIVGAYEREAIRPNVFSNFSELLTAAVLHPAMLLYLDNEASIGPNSRRGLRGGKSYNENLAREVLELHTVGIGGGYDVEDIILFAKALTGWTVGRNNARRSDKFGKAYFNPATHEPGSKMIIGHSFTDSGRNQAIEILQWLSSQTATANFIARKIVRHFVTRKPTPELTSALVESFLKTNGDLSALAETLVTFELSWSQSEWTYKTPQEFLISVGRAMSDQETWQDTKIAGHLGQPEFFAPSPEGWPQTGITLITAENILRRLKWLDNVVAAAPNWMNQFYLVENVLGGNVSQDLRDASAMALERGDALRMIMMSPEFLMR